VIEPDEIKKLPIYHITRGQKYCLPPLQNQGNEPESRGLVVLQVV